MKRTKSSDDYKSLSQHLNGDGDGGSSDGDLYNADVDVDVESVPLPLPQFKTTARKRSVSADNSNETKAETSKSGVSKTGTNKSKSVKGKKDLKPHYVLNIYIQDNNLKKKYKEQQQKNNEMIDDYLYTDKTVYFDAGIDLYTPNSVIVKKNTTEKINHEIKCSMNRVNPDGTKSPVCYYLYPRSSTGAKTPLRLSNSVGIIDAGYRGNIMACVDNHSNKDYTIKKGTRLFQICAGDLSLFKTLVLGDDDNLSVSIRGEKGLGSTG